MKKNLQDNINKKIGILYLHAGAELYGADKVLLELVKGLDKNIFYPVVILPNAGPLVDEMRACDIEVLVMDYPILRRKYFNLKGIFSYPYNYIKFSRKILGSVKEKNINIIHNNTLAVLEGVYLKKKLKASLIWHIHEILSSPYVLFRFLMFLAYRYSDKIVVVSEAVKNHILSVPSMSKKQIDVVYNGVDNNVFYPKVQHIPSLKLEMNIPKNAIVVGMIGRINSWKGQKDFVEACNLIMQKNINIYGIMVGGVFEGEEWRLKELLTEIDTLETRDKFRVVDFMKDTSEMYNLFDIFVLPSTSPDPLPTVVLEAMATGKSVIGYRHGGICEMVSENENGLLAEVGNTVDLSRKIEILVRDSELRKKFGQESLIRQKVMFSKTNYIQNFEKIYSS